MKQTYTIAIPSYRRPSILLQKTLAMLRSAKIPLNRVHVFVADDEDLTAYKAVLPPQVRIIKGVKGITPQRRFISTHFPEGTQIVSIDDDVETVYRLVNGKLNTIIPELDGFLKNAFKECKKHKRFIWGVYPTPNPFYMKARAPVSTDFKFILGTFFGYINRHDPSLVPTVAEKEDFELSALYSLKDGGTLRFNDICIKTRFHNATGGLGAFKDRLQTNEIAAKTLVTKYPDMFRIKVRKNGMYEVAVRRWRPPASP
jgi:hypothetical protein